MYGPALKSSITAAAIWIVSVQAAGAHGAERGLVMLLPTGYYLFGSALAVAASFLVLAVLPARWLARIGGPGIRLVSLPTIAPLWPSATSFVVLCGLLVAGYAGDTDPLANPLPVVVWTLWWIGLTLVQGVIGDVWPLINPWSAVAHLCRRGMGLTPPLRLPAILGYWPAILQFFAFAWFELIDLAPEDPNRLATAILAYWCINLAAVLVFGERDWFERGEPFSIFFRMIGKCSPLIRTTTTSATGAARTTLSLGWPGANFLRAPALPVSGILFVLLTLSSVSFDGLSRTFSWLAWIGINPLEFPGRSAVTGANTIGLLGAFATLCGIYFLTVWLGSAMAGRTDRFVAASAKLVYSIIPISLAFHFAHYLTVLLVNGQYAMLALNDPLALEWNLLGLRQTHVTTSFLTNLDDVSRIWNIQTTLIVVGHIYGIVAAHALASAEFGSGGAATKSQIALAILMVLYTVFGLWLLSTPSIG